MTSSDDGPHTRTLLPEDTQQGLVRRRPRPLRSLLIVLGVVVLLIVAIAIANRGGGGDSAKQGGGSGDNGGGTDSSAPPTAPSGVAPVTGDTSGIADGFAHSEQGAQSAAANYAVALGSDGMFATEQRHTIINAIATPTVTQKLQSDLDRAYTSTLYTRLGLDQSGNPPEGMTFVSRTVPAGTKVDEYSDIAATVGVWINNLTGLAGEGSKNPVTANWFTLTVKLQWTGEDWKLTAYSQQPGPAPVDGDPIASPADDIAGAIKDFGGFTYAR